jgi:DNA-binding NtrC family response regulator
VSARILVVDDDASIRETFERHLTRSGYTVHLAGDGQQALALLGEVDPALIITDVRMPGLDGLELLRRVREGVDPPDVLVITAHDDMRSAIEAMRAGAYDYLVKPLDLDEIDLLIRRCLNERALRGRIQRQTAAAAETHALDRLVGRHPRMIAIYKMIGMLAGNRAAVLVRGETGTGKERIARAIHFNSPAAEEPFLAVNCSALAETLLESELFGHVRGAFTGAVASRRGCFELAGTGTIFLDEIGDTSPGLQAKLLRVVETREFYPVGSERPRQSQARVIAATHRPLEALVQAGRFREDLYFRLKVVEIAVPPLRERPEDIPLLAAHLLARVAGELHRDVRALSDEALRELARYDWPGNVRELENALTRAAVLARGPVVGVEHLALGRSTAVPDPAETATVGDRLDDVERAHVLRVLARTGGNKRQAARLLGISRPRLDRLLVEGGSVASDRDLDGNGA